MPLNDRRCVSCRKLAPRSEFWRIVRDHPSGTVRLDEGMGRSAYICPTAQCLQAAQKKNRLSRALKTSVDNSLYQILSDRLTQ